MAVTVEIRTAPDGVEADVIGLDKHGKQVDLPHSIVITPYFFKQDSIANLVYATVKIGAVEKQRSVMQLSGSNGRVKMLDRSGRADPKFLESSNEEADAEYVEEDDVEGDED